MNWRPWRAAAAFETLRGPPGEPLLPALSITAQANRTIRYDNRLSLKFYGRIEEGLHPELELAKFLTEDHPGSSRRTIGRRHRIPPPGPRPDGPGRPARLHRQRRRCLAARTRSLERVLRSRRDDPFFPEPIPPAPLSRPLGPLDSPPPESIASLTGSYLALMRLLGNRLGEIHLTLGRATERPEFAPEPISMQYQRSLYQSMRNVLFDVMDKLGREKGRIPGDFVDVAARVCSLQPLLQKEFRAIAERPIVATRIRCPGECHLHQILFTGKDFVFIDFGGPDDLSVGERRIKRSPFRDVITLLRSFDYAAYAALFGLAARRGKAMGAVRQEDRSALLPWVLAPSGRALGA